MMTMRKDMREPAVQHLIEKIEDACYSDFIMLGHQNAGHIGVSISSHDGTESDVKNLTGHHPAVVGIDTLGLTGYEGNMEELVKTVKQLHREGVIITLSSHMPNFSLGGDKFIDYTPNITEGSVGKRIMPGGDLNGKYLEFLGLIADFASKCIDLSGERIPMIFRPFHEGNGGWFWWGSSTLSDRSYKDLFRYTIDVLWDKGVRNFAYCYSCNGVIASPSELGTRYPGDDYVDMVGLDFYHDADKPTEQFAEETLMSLSAIEEFCEEHGKPYAVTEIGRRTLDSLGRGYFEGLAPEGNRDLTWFTDILRAFEGSEAARRAAYMLFWANFSDTQFWVPYETSSFRHEMCGDFEKFCEDGFVRLAPGDDGSPKA